MRFCVKCGNQLNPDDCFCSKCGNKIFPSEDAAPKQTFISPNKDANTTPIDKMEQPKNKGIKYLIISLTILALSILGICVKGSFGAFMAWLALAAFVMLFVSGIMCIKYSRNCKKHKGRAIGIFFTVISCLIILIVVASLWAAKNSQNSNNLSSAPPSDEQKEIPADADNTPVSTVPKGTDWTTYEPLYIGNIPVGCLVVPDATPENVSDCIKEVLQTEQKFSAWNYDSEHIKKKIVVEELLDIYGCHGTAIFNFDWNSTLTSIVFKFEDGGNFTPELFNKLHEEICGVLGVENCWEAEYGLHKDAEKGNYCSCSWTGDLDFECKLTCYFNDEGKPDRGRIDFDRTVGYEKTNPDVLSRSDTIVQDAFTIKGTYHAGSNPYVEGTITNNSEETISFVKVKISLYDSNDKVIDTTWTYAVGAEGVSPGESSKWIVYCSDADAIKISLMK